MAEQPKADLETTAALLARARCGEGDARERLFARFLPLLQRWAHGRLPGYARSLAETDDLVQVALLRALNRIEAFEPRHEGAFLAYLRRILLNAVREEIRRTAKSRADEPLTHEPPAHGPSAVERAISTETLDAYEAALSLLPKRQQEAVVLRLEFGYTYPEIAAALERTSSNTARMMVTRAMIRISEQMHVER